MTIRPVDQSGDVLPVLRSANLFRGAAAEEMGIPEDYVILSCTHTHEGPHTRTLAAHPENFNSAEALWALIVKLIDE